MSSPTGRRGAYCPLTGNAVAGSPWARQQCVGFDHVADRSHGTQERCAVPRCQWGDVRSEQLDRVVPILDAGIGGGINDKGQICGYGINPSGQQDAFLLSPTPEPSVFVLLVVGAVGLLGYVSWRRWLKRSLSLAAVPTISSDDETDSQENGPAIQSLPSRWTEGVRRAA